MKTTWNLLGFLLLAFSANICAAGIVQNVSGSLNNASGYSGWELLPDGSLALPYSQQVSGAPGLSITLSQTGTAPVRKVVNDGVNLSLTVFRPVQAYYNLISI